MGRKKLTVDEKLERKRNYYKVWRSNNLEKTRKAAADWRERNLERSKEISNSWKKKNPSKHCAINAKRKAAMLKRQVPWADPMLIQEFYDEAARLTTETGVKHQVDHVIPLQGRECSGLHVQTNLQVLTATENLSKGNRFSSE